MKYLISIGDPAGATGVKVVTIRYYEQVRLMPTPLRTQGPSKPASLARATSSRVRAATQRLRTDV